MKDIRPNEFWAIEAPDNRATWRKVKILEFLPRNKILVELLDGPDKGKHIKIKEEVFIEEMKGH